MDLEKNLAPIRKEHAKCSPNAFGKAAFSSAETVVYGPVHSLGLPETGKAAPGCECMRN